MPNLLLLVMLNLVVEFAPDKIFFTESELRDPTENMFVSKGLHCLT